MNIAQLFDLFLSFVQVGLFSIGGGLAAMPIIQSQVVDLHSWLTIQEFTDLVTIAEMTPGPIAINAATFVGTQIAGTVGALVATVGCLLPSCIIVSVLGLLYFKFKNLSTIQGVLAGLRPAVVALIASAGLTILIMALTHDISTTISLGGINMVSVGLLAVALFLLRKVKVDPIAVMIGAGVIGGACYAIIGMI